MCKTGCGGGNKSLNSKALARYKANKVKAPKTFVEGFDQKALIKRSSQTKMLKERISNMKKNKRELDKKTKNKFFS